MASWSTGHVLDESGSRLARLNWKVTVVDAPRADGDVGSRRKADDQAEVPKDKEATFVGIEVTYRGD
jgi:hypothetical protein